MLKNFPQRLFKSLYALVIGLLLLFAANVGSVSAAAITIHPASQSIPVGASATLSVTATDATSYQWYQGISPDTSIPVGTNSRYFTTPVLITTTSYWVRVDGASIEDSVTAIITVYTPDYVVDSVLDTVLSACTSAPDDCTLRGAITTAELTSMADTITFDASVFSAPTAISLRYSLPTITEPLTINGPTTAPVTIQAGNMNSRRVFTFDSAGDVELTDLNLIGGNCYSLCPLAASSGGGIYNNNSHLMLNHVSISGNTATNGGGIYTVNATLDVVNTTLSSNEASDANSGGGITIVSGIVTLVNSTLSGNSTRGRTSGGGIYISGGTLTLINSTLVGNNAPTSSTGGLRALSGSVTLRNTIIASNLTAGIMSDCNGFLITNSNNLIGPTCYPTGTDINSQTHIARLAPLGNYGGATQTQPPLPGSPAIDNGNNATCALVNNLDQRGIMRPVNGNCDIGAVELRGFTLALVGGNNQSVGVDVTLPNPLAVSVTSAFGEPVNNGVVTFDPPDTGAGLTITSYALIPITNGVSSWETAKTNITPGSYSVIVSTRGATPSLTFNLTNLARDLTVDRADDDPSLAAQTCTFAPNDCTLRGSILTTESAAFPNADVIPFDQTIFNTPQTITVSSPLETNSSITINGNNRLTISGGGSVQSVIRISSINSSDLVIIDGVIIRDSAGRGIDVFSLSSLLLENSTVRNNGSSNNGGGIFNAGILTINNCTITDNAAPTTGGHFGGGIHNSGTLTITNSRITNNTATAGGGVHNRGIMETQPAILTISNTLISGNTVPYGSGGLGNFRGIATISQSTISNNIADYGAGFTNSTATATFTNTLIINNTATTDGGALENHSGTVTLNNTTLSGNGAVNGGGFFLSGYGDQVTTAAILQLNNSIVANNTGGDCALSVGHNEILRPYNSLVESGDCGFIAGTNGNLTGDPALDGNFVPLPISRVIDAGNNVRIPSGVTTDYAGNTRIQGVRVDMGAFETPFTAPVSVTSITRAGATPTNAANVAWTVTFSGAVTALSPANFALVAVGSSGGALTSVTGTGTTWTVSANTGIGEGTLALRFVNSNGMIPGIFNLPFDGEVYTLDKTKPTATITSSMTEVTNITPVPVTVHFSETVTGFDSADLITSNGSVQNFSGSGSLYTFEVIPLAEGVVTVDIPADAALDSVGNGNTAAARWSIIYSISAPPTLVEPVNQASLITRRPSLTWVAVPGASKYELQLGTTSSAATLFGNLTSPAFIPSWDLPMTTHYWRVRVFNSSGIPSPWSEQRSFTVAAPASAVPELGYFTGQTVTLSWASVSWAVGYELQVDTSTAFNTPARIDMELGANILTTPVTVASYGKYYWRVRAKRNATQWGAWGTVNGFVMSLP